MQSIIQQSLKKAIEIAFSPIQFDKPITPIVEPTKSDTHGDFSSSIALTLAKVLQQKPMNIAQQIVGAFHHLSAEDMILFQKVEVAAPGFINFFIEPKAWLNTLLEVVDKPANKVLPFEKQKEPILLEFVSSNPTGPLHVGHGRAAAHGDILARLLKAVGYQVYTEYYINDAGRQVDILACSIWLRYLEQIENKNLTFPSNGYQGTYITHIATDLHKNYQEAFYQPIETAMNELPLDEPKGGNKEVFIDALILRAKNLLGSDQYNQLVQFGLKYIIEDMQEDLTEFGVNFDHWFSEKSLIDSEAVNSIVQRLIDSGYTYQAEGNLWFRSTHFGDDKDRVLLRANGQPTYFAVDAAYRINILEERKFTRIINLLGADHHGYLARIHAVIQALGHAASHIAFSTLQMVSLYRDHEKLPLSTRSGEFITLRALREEVGNDAARVFFILRKSNQPIDFDLSLAKSQSHQNPVYYLQYAYARIASLTRQLKAKDLKWDIQKGCASIDALSVPEEMQIIKQLSLYHSILVQAAKEGEPSILLQYLRHLAKQFHSYYNQTPVLSQEETIRNARLLLIQGVKEVLSHGFHLLGIRSLESM